MKRITILGTLVALSVAVTMSRPIAQGNVAVATELSDARDAAVQAVSHAQSDGNADPLGAFTRLTQADAELDRLLEEVAEQRETTERLSRTFDQALFNAQSRVRGVSDYIDTRRGAIGPEARTRLAEAVRLRMPIIGETPPHVD